VRSRNEEGRWCRVGGGRKRLLRLALLGFGHDEAGVVVRGWIKVRCQPRMSMCGGGGDPLTRRLERYQTGQGPPPLAQCRGMRSCGLSWVVAVVCVSRSASPTSQNITTRGIAPWLCAELGAKLAGWLAGWLARRRRGWLGWLGVEQSHPAP
jgi:hypothetical protein